MAGDHPQSLGEFLRQERERRGITLEQLASATKIGIKTLHALEGDHYRELPATPFVRGFVNSYCRFVGLSPQEVLTEYQGFIASKAQERPNREGGHSGYAFEKKEGEQSRTWLSIVMGGAIAIGGALILILKPSFKHSRHETVEKLKASAPASPSQSAIEPTKTTPSTSSPAEAPTPFADAAPEPSATRPTPVATGTAPAPSDAKTLGPVIVATTKPAEAAPAPDAPASPTPSPTTSEKPDPLNSGVNLKSAEIKYKMVVRAKARIWVRYQVDGRPTMNFPMKEGAVLVLRAQELIRFQASNPEAVTYSVNGRAQQILAESKETLQKNKTSTLIFPSERAENIGEPFPGAAPLPRLESAPSSTASPTAPGV